LSPSNLVFDIHRRRHTITATVALFNLDGSQTGLATSVDVLPGSQGDWIVTVPDTNAYSLKVFCNHENGPGIA